MTPKQNQTIESQVGKKRGRGLEPPQPLDQAQEFITTALPDPMLAFKGGTVEAQVSTLQHLSLTQRQAMMLQISRKQGNTHALRVMAALKQMGPGAVQTSAAPAAHPSSHSPAARTPTLSASTTKSNLPPIQAKLAVSEPSDPYELEAERVADQVMRMPPAPATPPPPEDKNGASRSRLDRAVQASAGGGLEASGDVEARVQRLKGGGHPLPDSERAFFEERMGVDLNGVRLHTNSEAAQTSRDLDARAFTVGSDIAFSEREYQPGTTEGRRLMAHELTHVVQQGGSGPLRAKTIQRDGGEEEGVQPPEGGTPISKEGIVMPLNPGVTLKLRTGPSTERLILAEISHLTRLFVETQCPDPTWYYVNLNGANGYVASEYVTVNLPDPQSQIHIVQSGEIAVDIANRYYGTYIQWGMDLRFYINVLLHVNKEFGRDCSIYSPTGNWEDTVVVAGDDQTPQWFWIPSQALAESLVRKVSSGSISHELFGSVADLLNGLKQALEEVVNIIGELLEGALVGDFTDEPNIWNLIGQILVGFTPIDWLFDLRDLIATIWKIFKGEAGFLDLLLALVAFIPALGNIAKHADELSKAADFMRKLPFDEMIPLLKKLLGIMIENPKFAKTVWNNMDQVLDVLKHDEVLDVLKHADKLGVDDAFAMIKRLGGVDEFAAAISKLGGADEFVALAGKFGGLDELANAITKLGGADGLLTLITKCGGADELATMITHLGGVDEFAALLPKAGGIDKLLPIVKEAGGADKLAALLTKLGGFDELAKLPADNIDIVTLLKNCKGADGLAAKYDEILNFRSTLGGKSAVWPSGRLPAFWSGPGAQGMIDKAKFAELADTDVGKAVTEFDATLTDFSYDNVRRIHWVEASKKYAQEVVAEFGTNGPRSKETITAFLCNPSPTGIFFIEELAILQPGGVKLVDQFGKKVYQW